MPDVMDTLNHVMRRTQVYLTDDQARRLAELAWERGHPRAQVIRWALDVALGTGETSTNARAAIRSTAGLLADYPDWPEWQREVRGRTAAGRVGDRRLPAVPMR
jgi:hypothetical protein